LTCSLTAFTQETQNRKTATTRGFVSGCVEDMLQITCPRRSKYPSSATSSTPQNGLEITAVTCALPRTRADHTRRSSFLAVRGLIADYGRGRFRVPCRLRWRGMDRYGAASAYGWAGRPALEDRAPSRGRVPLASYFVPTMHRATPGTRTLPSFSNALTFAMACAQIRSRAGSPTC
jgi:hypothetical protein